MKDIPPAPKPPPTPEALDLCNHLVGEFMGLKAFCSALIETHPNPTALRAEFLRHFEATRAGFLAHPGVPDHTLSGMQALADELNSQLAVGR